MVRRISPAVTVSVTAAGTSLYRPPSKLGTKSEMEIKMLQANSPLVQQTMRELRAQDMVNAALSLYRKARWRGELRRVWSKLTRQRLSPLVLDGVGVADRHYGGVKPVLVSHIRGSIGRVSDFDADFNPIRSHIRDRWVGVATAWLRGVVLPPVTLVQVGNDYYVQDGNHRVSVAKALGRAMIDAEVIVS